MHDEELLASHQLEDGLWLCLWKKVMNRRSAPVVHHQLTIGGMVLMSAPVSTGSAKLLADHGLADVTGEAPRVLIGGLGFCFTLGAALDRLPKSAEVVVSELHASVVDWNRAHLSALEGHRLDDGRVRVEVEDVAARIRASDGVWDAILLDTDNGVRSFHRSTNDWLYSCEGLVATRRALRVGGVVAYWAIAPEKTFVERLLFAGFEVATRDAGSRDEPACVYVARRAV